MGFWKSDRCIQVNCYIRKLSETMASKSKYRRKAYAFYSAWISWSHLWKMQRFTHPKWSSNFRCYIKILTILLRPSEISLFRQLPLLSTTKLTTKKIMHSISGRPQNHQESLEPIKSPVFIFTLDQDQSYGVQCIIPCVSHFTNLFI